MAYTLTYELINNNTSYKVTGYTGEPVDVVIPKEYNALPVITIGSSAFFECSSLTSVVIGDSVTSIGYGVFEHCSSLTSVVIPDSVTSIGEYAFKYCSSLTSVEIGDSVTGIGEGAFYGCDSLTSVVIPDSVTSIGYNAFTLCSSLTSIVIPDSVTSISDYAFESCSSLIKVTLLAKTPPSLHGANVFPSNPTFYCFNEAIEAYKTASNWNTFANNFVADDMRLYFTMNSKAQKRYFVAKNELEFAVAADITSILWA